MSAWLTRAVALSSFGATTEARAVPELTRLPGFTLQEVMMLPVGIHTKRVTLTTPVLVIPWSACHDS